MANIVPDKLIDYAIFKDGVEKKGTGDVTLPDFEYMTETIKGAGIMGQVEMPSLGMLGKLPIKIDWRTITTDLIDLAVPGKTIDLEFRGAQQAYEAGGGVIGVQAIRVFARCLTKKTSLGKFATAATTGSSSELEAVTFKLQIDGKTVVDIDKFARVCNIGGVDWQSAVRSALGI